MAAFIFWFTWFFAFRNSFQLDMIWVSDSFFLSLSLKFILFLKLSLPMVIWWNVYVWFSVGRVLGKHLTKATWTRSVYWRSLHYCVSNHTVQIQDILFIIIFFVTRTVTKRNSNYFWYRYSSKIHSYNNSVIIVVNNNYSEMYLKFAATLTLVLMIILWLMFDSIFVPNVKVSL